jgi:sugar phosphate isomerase/epimerase
MLSSRREFLKKIAISAGVLPFIHTPLRAVERLSALPELSVHIFSKHLQFLVCKTAAAKAVELGFVGLDLTVRPGGHVLPANVKTELPKAIKDIKAAGARCDMIATSVEDVDNSLDRDVLETAAANGVKYYRCNWFKYPEGITMPEALLKYQNEIHDLGLLNKKLGIVGSYQNHAGRNVGASFWEVDAILKTVDPAFFGTQYDIRHAYVEGANSWENGFELLRQRIKIVVLKDYRWEKIDGKWQALNVPIGEGMVDFDKFFKLLKRFGLHPPVSLHCEYDMGGAEKGNRNIAIPAQQVFDAIQKDLVTVQKLWQQA